MKEALRAIASRLLNVAGTMRVDEYLSKDDPEGARDYMFDMIARSWDDEDADMEHLERCQAELAALD